METINHVIGNPIFAVIIGWIFWTIFMLSTFKDSNEKTFNFIEYEKEHWDNQLLNFVGAIVLLYVGYNKFEIGVGDDADKVQWNDLYYLFSGFAVELVKSRWDAWKSKKKD
jgi:hypothetical protein